MDSNMQAPPPMSSIVPGASELDAGIWRALAGAAVKVPAVNSYVYYFPQGHLEQSSPSSSASDDVGNFNFALARPWIPCQVLRVRFLSNSASDQAFVRILLQPLQPLGPRPRDVGRDREDDGDNNDVVSFAKVLTRSDANNGGGFSVPRDCADNILPPLNLKAAPPPVQNLVVRDTHGVAWEFRHIYRGTPRRHLLTTGWSKFVNAKRLVAGDSVVFIRRMPKNELFVGVRRARGFPASADRGEALAAISAAVRGVPFEVVYQPRVGVPDFVVRAEKVKEALRMSWTAGMRVRMAVEADGASSMTWIQGVIAAVDMPLSGVWCGSPWRMLQINWDDPEISPDINRVSPWQLEFMPFATMLEPDFRPSKRLRALQDPAALPHGERTTPSFSSGIQRARLDHTSTSGTADEPELRAVSTVLTIGSSYSGTASPPSRSSTGGSSFQLFGKTIQLPGPGDSGTSPSAGCTGGGDRCT